MSEQIINPSSHEPSYLGGILCKISTLWLPFFCSALFFEKINNTLWIVIPCLLLLIWVSSINLQLSMRRDILRDRWKFFNLDLGRGTLCIIHLLVSFNTALQTYNSKLIIAMLFSHQLLLALAAAAHICNHYKINSLRNAFSWPDNLQEIQSQDLLALNTLKRIAFLVYLGQVLLNLVGVIRSAMENIGFQAELLILLLQSFFTLAYFYREYRSELLSAESSGAYQLFANRALYKIVNGYILLLIVGKLEIQTLLTLKLLLITTIWIIGMIELFIIMKVWFKEQANNNLENPENPSAQSDGVIDRELYDKYLIERLSMICLVIYGFFSSAFMMAKDCIAGLTHASWIAAFVAYSVAKLPADTSSVEETRKRLDSTLRNFFTAYFMGFMLLESCINKDTKYSDGSVFEKLTKILGLIVASGFLVTGVSHLSSLVRKKLSIQAAEASVAENSARLTRAEIETNLMMKSMIMAEVSTQVVLLLVLIIRFIFCGEFLVFGILTSFWVLCNLTASFYWEKIDSLSKPLRRGLLSLILVLAFWPLRYILEKKVTESLAYSLFTRTGAFLHQFGVVLLILLAITWTYLHIKTTRSSQAIEFNRLASEAVETEENEIPVERVELRPNRRSSSPRRDERPTRVTSRNEPSPQSNMENPHEDGREIIRRYYVRRNKRDKKSSRRTKRVAVTRNAEEETKASEEEKINELTTYFEALSKLAKQ